MMNKLSKSTVEWINSLYKESVGEIQISPESLSDVESKYEMYLTPSNKIKPSPARHNWWVRSIRSDDPNLYIDKEELIALLFNDEREEH